MKNNQLVIMLVFVLLVSAVGNVWFTFRFVWANRQLQVLQPRAAQAGEARNLVESLLADTSEYAKKNPDIVPVMQSFFQSPSPSPAK